MNTHGNHTYHIPLSGVLLLIFVSFLWGGNMVSIKVGNQGLPPILAATLRSIGAATLLWLYARTLGETVWFERAEMKHAVAIGFLFGAEFLFLYWGSAFTDASRAVIFLYAAPMFIAIGAHFFLFNDRLTRTKILGLLFAFSGLFVVFGSRSPALGPLYWVGDVMELFAALFWAITTIYVKKVVHDHPVTHIQTLFAQLFFAIPILAFGFWCFETTQQITFTALAASALAYQTVVVGFFSYTLWFWMISRYQVSRLAAFTFLTPLFGVILSGHLLGELLTPSISAGLTLVALGIYLVNRPSKEPSECRTAVVAGVE